MRHESEAFGLNHGKDGAAVHWDADSEGGTDLGWEGQKKPSEDF